MTSLTAIRISSLEETNRRIQAQLDSILETGKRNEEKFHWLRDLVLSLMDVSDLEQLDDVLGGTLIARNKIDETRLFLWDVDLAHAYRHIRCAEDLGSMENRVRNLEHPVCETIRLSEYEVLFNKSMTEPTSVALIPIWHSGIRGLLTIGSDDPLHFRLDMSTLFLDFLGRVVGRTVARIC